MKYRKHPVLMMILGVFLFVFDRVCKYIAISYPEKTMYVYKNFIGWGYYENTGIAFSIPIPRFFILLFTILFLILLLGWLYKLRIQTRMMCLGVSLIIAGAVSNFLDRMMYGFTIDYFIMGLSVINIADIGIVVGSLLIFLEIIRNEKRCAKT